MFQENFDLTPYTTFRIPAKARIFAEYSSVKELTRISRTPEFTENEVLHIGGGSNLFFINDFNGLVLHSAIKGIQRYDSAPGKTYVICGAAEKWTDLVDWTVVEGLAGLENLAGIPGEVGAAPVQNVGAYGVEAADVIHSVECFDTITRQLVTFTADECKFGYRDSIFKHKAKGRFFVIRVSFRLTPSTVATNLEYGPLKELETRLGHRPSIAEVKCEVEKIRNAKLPDPAEIGSAGSFFKNPVMSLSFFEGEVLRRRPDTPCYRLDDNTVKVSAAWLIDHSGMKGKSCGDAVVWQKQPLVIANTGHATATDIVRLTNEIEEEVNRNFGIHLQPEVNFIDTDIRVTILGSGTSKGIPEVGCRCEVCRSTDPHDKRRRASVFIETHGLKLLIDASPDFRIQALDNNIKGIDAVLVTHNHADHVGGFDDLRPFCTPDIPVFLRQDVKDSLLKRYDYCFTPNPYPGVPRFDLREINNSPFFFRGLKITPISVLHGNLPIVGYRIGDFAYITDAKTIPEEELSKLLNLKLLIINALRDRDHFAHLTINEALAIVEKLRPEKVLFTHLCHEAPQHELLAKRLREACRKMHGHIDSNNILTTYDHPDFPRAIEPAFDGETIIIH